MRIIKDLHAITGGSWKKAIATILTNPCFHAVCLYRLSALFYKVHLTPFAKLIWYINRVIYSVDIDYGANLAGGFKMVHGIGIVIGRGVKSEGRLTVYQGVTIGGNMGRHREIKGNMMYHPYIEDNVVIFSHAAVFGPAHLLADTKIKAGSIVTEKGVYK